MTNIPTAPLWNRAFATCKSACKNVGSTSRALQELYQPFTTSERVKKNKLVQPWQLHWLSTEWRTKLASMLSLMCSTCIGKMMVGLLHMSFYVASLRQVEVTSSMKSLLTSGCPLHHTSIASVSAQVMESQDMLTFACAHAALYFLI